MLSLQDEACKFLVRSEMISYHRVNANFFPTILPEEGLEKYHSYDVSKQPFTKKLFFFLSEGKIFGILMRRVILVILGMFRNFGHDND